MAQTTITSPKRADDAEVNIVKEKTRQLQEKECKAKIVEMGIKDYHAFPNTITFRTVLEAIHKKTEIDNVDIAAKVQSYTFRFYTKDYPLLSLETSNAIAETVKEIKTPSPQFSAMGRQKRTENADEYARNMYKLIAELKTKEKISSFRQTVKALNKKKVPTPLSGKEWHVSTLQNLQKRWQELGLNQLSHKPK
jgi:hypothetical protein